MRYGLCFPLILLLGCGGGGGSDADTSNAVTFQTELQALNRLPVTTAADLPTTGSGNYSGEVQLQLPIAGQSSSYRGDLHIAFAFDQPTDFVSGQIDRLRRDGNVLAGTLALSNGSLDRAADPDRDYQFSADLAGTLMKGSVDYDANGEMSGDFRGSDASVATGVVAGTLESDEEGLVLFDGAFFAEAE